MAKDKKAPETPVQANEAVAVHTFLENEDSDGMSIFDRQINSISPVKSITLKRQLTRSMVAMVHQKELLFTCESEMYTKLLPASGRSDKPQPATLINGIDLETGEPICLICNIMMVSALETAKFPEGTALSDDPQTRAAQIEKHGVSLIGRSFAFRNGRVRADKKYLIVETVEIEVERSVEA
jgi:hypothetical protein